MGGEAKAIADWATRVQSKQENLPHWASLAVDNLGFPKGESDCRQIENDCLTPLPATKNKGLAGRVFTGKAHKNWGFRFLAPPPRHLAKGSKPNPAPPRTNPRRSLSWKDG
jgi:hypothetical protein